MTTSESTVHSGTRSLRVGKLAPVFGFTQRILVANDKCWLHFIAETQQAVIGIAAKNKSDIAFREARGSVGYGLGKKAVVTQICVRIKRHRRKERDNGFAEEIAGFDSDIERGIVEGTL